MNPTVDQLVVVDLPQFREPRGVLVPVEFLQYVPFEVKRMFWVANVPPGGVRGGHAHRLCHQFAICISGRVAIEAFDGRMKQTIELTPGQAVHIKPGILTRERFIEADSILSVLCDRPYEPEDYVYQLD